MKNFKIHIAWLSLVAATNVAPFGKYNQALAGPSNFSYEGRAYDGSGNALTGSATFTLRIYNPAGTCILYEENSASSDLSASSGYFSVSVGTGTLTSTTPGSTLSSTFSNRAASITGSGSGCPYVPSVSDGRLLEIVINPANSSSVTLSPKITIGSSPFAMVADDANTVGGLPSNSFINTDSLSLTQSNVSNVFSTANYPILTSLLAGTNSNYVASSSSGAKIPTVTASPASPSAGQIWFSSSANAFQYYNGSSVQTIGTSGAGISSLTVGSSLTAAGISGGTLNSSGTVDLANSGVVAGTYPKLTVNNKGLVTSGTSLSESDLPTILSAGKVAGDAITSGTISGTAAVNTSGSVTTSSNISGLNISSSIDSTRSLKLFDPASGSSNYITLSAPTLTANYSVVLPNAQGTAGTTLMNDGSGHLSWVTGSAGSVTSVGLSLPSIFSVTIPTVTSTGNLTAGLVNQSANLIFSGPSSGSAASPGFRGLTVADLPSGYDATVLKTTLAANKIWIGGTSGTAAAVTPSGDILLSIAGSGTVTRLQGYPVSPTAPINAGQMLRWSGSQWTPNFVAMTDLRSSITGTNSFATSCAASQTLVYNSVGDTMTCTAISIANSQIAWASTGANLVFAGPTGSSGSPSFRSLVASDLPSGIASQWITNGTSVSYGSGNVGIGTTTPTSALHVVGTAATYITTQTSSASDVGFRASSAGATTILSSSGTQGIIGTTTSSSLAFMTGGSSRAIIDPAGNFGIGTTSPAAIFDVNGLGVQSAMIVPRDTTTSRPTGVNGMLRYNTSLSQLETYSSGAWSGILNANNASTSYLPLQGGTLTGAVAHPIGSASAPSINFGDATTGLYSPGSGNISLATAAISRLTISSSGNIGIGTTAPTATLEVRGHFAVSGVAPSISGCGSSASLSGSDTRGMVTVGSGGTSSCVISFNSAYTSIPYCVAAWNGTGPTTIGTTVSSTSLTISFGASVTSGAFTYICLQ